MGFLDRLFGTKPTMTAKERLAKMEDKKNAVQQAQKDRDDALQDKIAQREALRLDAAANEPEAVKKANQLDIEIAQLEAARTDAARVLADVGGDLQILREQVEVEKHQEAMAAQGKRAAAIIKRLPIILVDLERAKGVILAAQEELSSAAAGEPDLIFSSNVLKSAMEKIDKTSRQWLEHYAHGQLSPFQLEAKANSDAAEAQRTRMRDIQLGVDAAYNQRPKKVNLIPDHHW